MAKMNPDSEMLSQMDGQWQKYAMMLLWKLAKRELVKVTAEDIAEFTSSFEPGIPVMYTHGHSDSIDFQIVDEASAQRLVDHDATMRGTA